jgi:hypothetical protein
MALMSRYPQPRAHEMQCEHARGDDPKDRRHRPERRRPFWPQRLRLPQPQRQPEQPKPRNGPAAQAAGES